ncbi:MAG: hypothetical protein EP343_09800 [Deltaproteobacteria bacterium]|nr:MAG: hypothetical protein EP343_09800 [Deltaproteobacteria bacterium]
MSRKFVLGSLVLCLMVVLAWAPGCSQPVGSGEGGQEGSSSSESSKEVVVDISQGDEGAAGEPTQSEPGEEKSSTEPGEEVTQTPEEPKDPAEPNVPEEPSVVEEPEQEKAPAEVSQEPGQLEKLNPDAGSEPTPPEQLPTDNPPGCGKLGARIKLTEQCCSGLKKGSVGSPPGCVTTGQDFVCVNCGDGQCDSSNGETECNCAQDCKPANNGCEQASGTCQNSRLPCAPGTVQDNSLACGNPALICCKPSSTTGCKVDCDCTQGLLCAPGTGKCVPGIVPTYCCDKPGCPTGKACTDASGTKGTCP